MMFGIITKDDKDLIKKILSRNVDEVNLWRIPNLVIPFIIIIATILIYIFFQPFEAITLKGGLGFLVNGSLPLIAVNQIAGVGIYIFKFNKTQEAELGIETTRRIRTNLFFQVFCIILFTTLVYAYQTIYSPFDNYVQIAIIFFISIFLVYISYCISRKIYILQEDFINVAFDVGIRSNAQVLKSNWDDYQEDLEDE